LLATRRAFLAGLDALLHALESRTVLRAFAADLGAFAAGMLVMRRADQHEMRRRSADLGARHHQPEMLRRDMFAAFLEAMPHGRAQADRIAVKAIIDAVLHLLGDVVHFGSPRQSN